MRPHFEIIILRTPLRVTTDTGSTCNIIDQSTFQKINENYIKSKGMEVKLSSMAQEILTCNSDKPISLLGKFKAHAESKGRDIIIITF